MIINENDIEWVDNMYFVDIVDERTRHQYKDKLFHCVAQSKDVVEAIEYAVKLIKEKKENEPRLWKVRVVDADNRKILQVTNNE